MIDLIQPLVRKRGGPFWGRSNPEFCLVYAHMANQHTCFKQQQLKVLHEIQPGAVLLRIIRPSLVRHRLWSVWRIMAKLFTVHAEKRQSC